MNPVIVDSLSAQLVRFILASQATESRVEKLLE
jgi:hypothetical protein